MQKPDHLFHLFMLIAAIAFCSLSARAQTSADVYNGIKMQPSTIRWCLPQAGDDPAHIIGDRCKVYRDCLSDLSLDESIDRNPMPSLTPEQVGSVRKCHQALFNAARMNPQAKAQLRRSSGCSTRYIRAQKLSHSRSPIILAILVDSRKSRYRKLCN